MATSIKAVLRKKRNQDGTYPLAIRITADRKTTYKYLGHNLQELDWDAINQKVKKSYPNSARLNNLILQKKAEYSGTIITIQTNGENVSPTTIKSHIAPKRKIDFFFLADQHLENSKREGNYNMYKPNVSRLKHFEEFLGKREIAFSDINLSLLKQFRAYLKETRNNSESTIYNHLVIIKTIYDTAINNGILDKKNYPFGKNGVPMKAGQTLKIGLTIDEVKNIESLQLENISFLNHARNIWLISFYFAGMRISDVFRMKWSDIHDDRLYYAMGKNLKAGSLKIPEKALRIINQYQKSEKKHDLIFPDLKLLPDLDNKFRVKGKIASRTALINKALKEIAELAKIKKNLSMHIARHTFGNISGDKIPIQMLQKLYRHSSIATTVGYQANFVHKTADDALEAVIGN
jgi:site-specific recombinase XerD